MDISARTDYAVRAALTLADRQAAGLGPASTEELARIQDLPRKFLEAILADLRRAGVVVSQRGPAGGYALTRPAAETSVGAVFRAVAGPLAEVRGLRPHETTYSGVAGHLPELWVAVRASLRHVLDETSLEQLRTGNLPRHVRRLVEEPDAWDSR